MLRAMNKISLVVQEVREEEGLGLLVSHTCTTLHLQQTEEGGWRTDRQINWNCHPLSILPAGPYILALSADTLEIRWGNSIRFFSTLKRSNLFFIAQNHNWNASCKTIIIIVINYLPPRSNVNGTLLQTLNLPKLQFLSAKEDLYFTTTKQVSKGYNLLCDFYFLL